MHRYVLGIFFYCPLYDVNNVAGVTYRGHTYKCADNDIIASAIRKTVITLMLLTVVDPNTKGVVFVCYRPVSTASEK